MNCAMSAELPDFSKRAIDWAVLSSSLQHPAVIYPAAAGVLGGLGAALLTASPALITGAAIGGGVALVSLGVNCLLRRIAAPVIKAGDAVSKAAPSPPNTPA